MKIPLIMRFFKEEWERLLVVEKGKLRIGNECDCYALSPEWYQKLRGKFEDIMIAGISDNARKFLDKLLFSNTIDDEYSHTDEQTNFANLFVKDKEYQPNEVVLLLRALYRTYYPDDGMSIYTDIPAEQSTGQGAPPPENIPAKKSKKHQRRFVDSLSFHNKEELMNKLHELLDNQESGRYVATVLLALKKKNYLIKTYSTKDVIAEFSLKCSGEAINKFTRESAEKPIPEKEISQIIEVLP